MLLEIDEQSEQPIYQQLIDQIIVGIAKGELVPNESLRFYPTIGGRNRGQYDDCFKSL